MKIYAMYLPQFHTFKENDEWWGKGFTEWVNTKKAKPLYKNHYQPKTPLNNNYYNLLNDSTMEEQAKLAKKYGIDGFIFYHYWFNGKLLMEKPEQYRGEKYILCYFLGNLSDEKKEAINAIAKEKKCKIINLLDKNDLYYSSSPSEFLWLEKNAELICTDLFHSSVFGFLFNRPFVVFKRRGNGNNMYSRIETLISKFKLQNRIFDGNSITKDDLNHDYTESYKILEIEKNKSINFLRKSLYIK